MSALTDAQRKLLAEAARKLDVAELSAAREQLWTALDGGSVAGLAELAVTVEGMACDLHDAGDWIEAVADELEGGE